MITTQTQIEAESILLGCCIGRAEQLQALADKGVSRSLFMLPKHKTIWEALVKIAKTGENPDVLALVRFLEAEKTLEGVGGMHGVAELGGLLYMSRLESALEMLFDLKQKRDIEEYADNIVQMANDPNINSRDLLAETEKQMSSVRTMCGVEDALTLKQAANNVLDSLEWRLANPGKVRGLESGFPRLDAVLDGLQPENMIIVAARPGVGKTAILINMLTHLVFSDTEVPCGMFSLEMSKTQIVERITFSRAGINAAALRGGKPLNRGQQIAFGREFKRIVDARLYVDDRPALTIEQIQAKARRMVYDHGVKCIGVDYLQLAKASSQQAKFSREREISEISAGLKAMAKELKIPVIALAQLNREAEKRSGKIKGMPMVADLRESGAIEQDADQIILIHRPYVYDKEADPEDAKALIGKNRFGELGYVDLKWDAAMTTYTEAKYNTESK